MGLNHTLDGVTNLKYKLLHFLTTNFFCKEKKALAFNGDRCCHLVLCLQLILFHYALGVINYAPRIINYAPRAISYAPREHM